MCVVFSGILGGSDIRDGTLLATSAPIDIVNDGDRDGDRDRIVTESISITRNSDERDIVVKSNLFDTTTSIVQIYIS